MITMRRFVIVALATVVSAYPLLVGWYSLPLAHDAAPYLAAMGVYAVATIVSLWPVAKLRMPAWMAIGNLAVCVSMPPLVSPQLDVYGSEGSDYRESGWRSRCFG